MNSVKKKAKIVIASVLKPVDDVRNYEKIGMSIANHRSVEVIMCGTLGNTKPANSIRFHAWNSFKRLGFSRLKVQFQFWKFMKNERPDLVILTTHELLVSASIFKVFFGGQIIYDVQEDYFKNLWFQHFYPAGFRHLLAIGIRSVEWITTPFIRHYFLAETVYQKDILFLGNKSTILDNKALPITKGKRGEGFKVVFTGTISHYSKTVESIELFLKIREQFESSRMVVIGYAPKASYKEHLEVNYRDQVELRVEGHPVPHNEIEKEIATADLAIIGYEPNPINHLKVPTKLYEYVAAKVPYIVRVGSYWEEVGEQLGGGIPIDFMSPDLSKLKSDYDQISENSFSDSGHLWAENEANLLKIIDNLIVDK